MKYFLPISMAKIKPSIDGDVRNKNMYTTSVLVGV